MQRVRKYLEKEGIAYTDGMLDKFEVYYSELIEWNNKFNLTAITDRDGIIIKHFIDSLTILKYIEKDAEILDIGSGAGFPSIPLMIVREDIKVTMLDSLNKRVGFLQFMIERLGLKGAEAVHARAEDYIKGRREHYDIVTARAVARLNVLLEYSVPYVKAGGKFIAMKSEETLEEITEASNALKILKCDIEKVDTFNLPETDISRALIIVKKLTNTPELYPRGKNLPRKKPL